MMIARIGAVLILFVYSSAKEINGLCAQSAPVLSLRSAIETGLQNYQSIRAKRNYAKASEALVLNTRKEYLPNVIASLQQAYGTVNGQFGPLAPSATASPASAGPAYGSQSWNAGFGASYLLSTNWEFFSFGRLSSKVKLFESQLKRDSADLFQEEFIQSVKVSSAYLNLLAAQKLIENAEANLTRAIFLQQVVLARTKSGLNAGVDSSIANAQVSSARLSVIGANDYELQVRNQLLQLLDGDPSVPVSLDSIYLKSIPGQLTTGFEIGENPQIRFYQARINQSNQTVDYLKKSILPGLNLFGIFQSRGSGFGSSYNPANEDTWSKGYWNGINPVRSNYVAGVSVAWNILSIAKIKEQVIAQQYISKAYQEEYNLVRSQLKDQLILSDQRLGNSLQSIREAPIQLQAATEAYGQKSVLYKNGLTNIVDLQQAIYALNKAETDMSIAYINVWQALLMKSAASGDFNLFLGQIK